MALVPELYCMNLEETRRFFQEVLGFTLRYARLEEGFVYLEREGVEVMFERLEGEGRRWRTGVLERPFGRGVNFQCDVSDVRALYDSVCRLRPECVYLALERASYRCGARLVSQEQFVVQDPDGYLFRFCQEVDG